MPKITSALKKIRKENLTLYFICKYAIRRRRKSIDDIKSIKSSPKRDPMVLIMLEKNTIKKK